MFNFCKVLAKVSSAIDLIAFFGESLRLYIHVNIQPFGACLVMMEHRSRSGGDSWVAYQVNLVL